MVIRRCIVLAFCVTSLCACSNTMKASQSTLGSIGSMPDRHYQEEPEQKGFDPAAEEAIATGCLKAHRLAIARDEKGAMAVLDKLEKRYPHSSTTKQIRAQCYEMLGKKKEALKFYQDALSEDRFSSFNLFKVAELKRTSGSVKESISDYRELIKKAPDFTPAKLGLAKALIATGSPSEEALQNVKQVLETEPSNAQATQLLEQLQNK